MHSKIIPPMLVKIISRVGKRLPPFLWAAILLIQQLLHVSGIVPGDEVILVPELPVEGRDGITAVFRDVLHRDSVDVPLSRQLSKGFCQQFLGRLSLHLHSSSHSASLNKLESTPHESIPNLIFLSLPIS